jgi:hypothetical protein
LERLYQYLCLWAYEVYDTLAHPALSQSPREAYAAGIAHSGQRLHRLIPYDADFRIFTFPTTSKGTALVVPGLGVKINNIYYWNESFRSPDVERTRVEVRFDPCDAGAAWAFVSHRWVECFSEHYAVFHQRSERELMIASQELRRRKGLHSKQFRVTAARLAQFLESVESEEALLRQRLADSEARVIRKMINGGQIPSPDEVLQTECKSDLFHSEPLFPYLPAYGIRDFWKRIAHFVGALRQCCNLVLILATASDAIGGSALTTGQNRPSRFNQEKP